MCMKMNNISEPSHRLSTFLLLSLSIFLLHCPVLCPWFFSLLFFLSSFQLFFSLLWFFFFSLAFPSFVFLTPPIPFYYLPSLSVILFFLQPSLNHPLSGTYFTPHSRPTHTLIITLVFNLPLTSHLFIISRLSISSC